RDDLLATQSSPGHWFNHWIGPEYATAMSLLVLQRPNNLVPVYERSAELRALTSECGRPDEPLALPVLQGRDAANDLRPFSIIQPHHPMKATRRLLTLLLIGCVSPVLPPQAAADDRARQPFGPEVTLQPVDGDDVGGRLISIDEQAVSL